MVMRGHRDKSMVHELNRYTLAEAVRLIKQMRRFAPSYILGSLLQETVVPPSSFCMTRRLCEVQGPS